MTNDVTVIKEYNLADLNLYGSDRLGMITINQPVSLLATGNYTVTKQYELKNHLGNILATVSATKNTNNTAEVLTAQDYYPFGSIMPGRSFGSGYKFGFNGMEKDDEISGQSGSNYTTLFRIYDSRIGWWQSPDPKTKEMPWESPYVSMGGNPILFSDPLGDNPYTSGKNGMYFFANTDKTGDQISVWGGFLPFGSLAEPVAGLFTGMRKITEDDIEKVINAGLLAVNTATDAADVLKVGGKVGGRIVSILGATINIYGTADYYIDYFTTENWEVDEIVQREFRITGKTRDEVIVEYVQARTLINDLMKSGDITYEYIDWMDTRQLQYNFSEKAKELVKNLDIEFFKDSMDDFESSDGNSK